MKIKVLFILAAFILLLSGCSKFPIGTSEIAQAMEEELAAEETEYNEEDFPDITKEDVKSAPILSQITQKQLAEANSKEVQAILAKNYGTQFRESFSIKADRILEEKDWQDIKAFLYFQLFQTFIYVDEAGNEILLLDTSNEKGYLETMFEDDRQKAVYEKQARDFVEGLSKEEFIERLFYATVTDLELSDEDQEKYLDTLLLLSDEEISQLKEGIIQKLLQYNDTSSIPKTDIAFYFK